ncbi:MAG: outer membrane beta-barrel protein, partial [Ferruginibacter sp.]|nr:outer membrane beta-barrel protein [Ferruginibacter sp.]
LLPAGGGRGWFMGGFGQVQSSAQGFIRPIYGADLSIRKNFLKNNMGSITIAWSDIFRTRLQESFSSSDFFIQDNSRRRDPQVVRISFNYRFGKFDAALFKRKNIKNEMENMQNMQGE